MAALMFKILSWPLTFHPTVRARILPMSRVWAFLGAVMGASLGMEAAGVLGAIAGMLAGISELAAFGVIFALAGGSPQETVLGSVGGLLGGLAVGLMGGPAPVVLLANVGLFAGAIVGATLHACLRLLSFPIILLERSARRRRRPAAIALRNDGRVERQPHVPAFHCPARAESRGRSSISGSSK
jgi:hypothetical protein